MNTKRWMGVLAVLAVLGLSAFLVVRVRASGPSLPAVARQMATGPKANPGPGWCQAYLRDKRQAQALGVTVDQLRASRVEAAKASLEEAYNNGRMTQQEYQAQLAWLQVRSQYLNPEALVAKALNMRVDELHAACESGKRLQELLQEKGMDMRTFRQQMEEAAVAQVLQALQDGVVTQEQLVRILLRQQARRAFQPGGRQGKARGKGMPAVPPLPATP